MLLLLIIITAVAGILWYRSGYEAPTIEIENLSNETQDVNILHTPLPTVEAVTDPSAEHPSNIFAY